MNNVDCATPLAVILDFEYGCHTISEPTNCVYRCVKLLIKSDVGCKLIKYDDNYECKKSKKCRRKLLNIIGRLHLLHQVSKLACLYNNNGNIIGWKGRFQFDNIVPIYSFEEWLATLAVMFQEYFKYS